jgi:hypothetical protein
LTLREEVARIIAQDRGADPDQPITITGAEGAQQFEKAWEGYAPLADRIIVAVNKPKKKATAKP